MNTLTFILICIALVAYTIVATFIGVMALIEVGLGVKRLDFKQKMDYAFTIILWPIAIPLDYYIKKWNKRR